MKDGVFLTEDSFPAEERGANVRSSSEEYRFLNQMVGQG